MSLLKRAERQGGKFLNPVPTRVGGLSMIFKVLPLYLKNKEEKTPRVPPGPFVTDARSYATEGGERFAGDVVRTLVDAAGR